MRENQPDLATFYSNHVAAAMHRYWAALFPEDYEDEPMDADWRETYGAEIVGCPAAFLLALNAATAAFTLAHSGIAVAAILRAAAHVAI